MRYTDERWMLNAGDGNGRRTGRILSGESLIGYERITHAVNLSHSCWTIWVGTGYAVGIVYGGRG